MANTRPRTSMVIAGMALALVMTAATGAAAQEGAKVETKAPERVLGPQTRRALSLTLYGGNLAMVRDSRAMAVAGGANRIVVEGLSRRLIPESLLVLGEGFSVGARDFLFDLLTPDALLRHAVGHEVVLVKTNEETGKETRHKAEVLAVDRGVVLRVDGAIVPGVPGRLEFPAIPPGLRPRPALVLRVEAEQAGERPIALAYLSEGLSWSADYVATLADDGRSLSLTGYATLENRSGTDFPDARIQLVAGEPHRVGRRGPTPPPQPMRVMAQAADAEMAESKDVERQSLGNIHHIYTLRTPLSLGDNQSRQVALLAAPNVAVNRVHEFTTEFHPRGRSGEVEPVHASLRLEMTNDNQDGPGVPLPGGVVRVYARQASGELQFLGEDRLDAVPVGGEAKVFLGRSFDVTAKKVQTDFERLGERSFETAFRLTISNGGETAAPVRVAERVHGDWELLSSSHEPSQRSANTLEWRFEVPGSSETELTYRVRIRR